MYETSVGVCTCECVFVYMCIFRVQDRYLYCTPLPMVYVGFPTGWCLPSPCVQWGKSTCPSAFFPCTASTDDTTWISTITGLCVVWVWMYECVILTTHFVYVAPCLWHLQYVVSGLLQHNFSVCLHATSGSSSQSDP